MNKITYTIDGQATEVEAVAGETLLQIGLEAGLMIESSCGGNGFCTTCKCTVKEGADSLSELHDNEENMGINEPERLSCLAVVTGNEDITVVIEE